MLRSVVWAALSEQLIHRIRNRDRTERFSVVRLLSLKLAGFKSFADPTTVDLPGQMVGVVGPNGCGKSNIIDAVRWVLGESRASELRGGSMQDVIFNGTDTRNPAGRCSVEMLFDNGEHRMGGQWREYAQIAVRRVLSRSGGSQYFLNNQQVRRRDVQDVFLGTGLGPRAYAIIGQGTISRIIESRPEELRLFLEEAAGVSKYKERRRETENRLADTQENLLRVQDVLGELAKQLTKLEKQAAVAQEYGQLNERRQKLEWTLWFQIMQEAQAKETRANLEMREQQNALEERLAAIRRNEAELEETRQAHYEAGDALNAAQGLLYEAGADVAKYEAEIRFVTDSQERLQARGSTLQQRYDQAQTDLAGAAERIEGATEELAGLREQQETAAAQLEEQESVLPELEQRQAEYVAVYRTQQMQLMEMQQRLNRLQSDARLHGQQHAQCSSRQAHLQQQLAQSRLTQDGALEAAQAILEQEQQRLHELEAEQEQLLLRRTDCEQQRDTVLQRLQEQRQRQAAAESELQTLQTLQQEQTADNSLAQQYAVQQGLDRQPIWEQVRARPGWETALETALGGMLTAVGVVAADWGRVVSDGQARESGLLAYRRDGADRLTGAEGAAAAGENTAAEAAGLLHWTAVVAGASAQSLHPLRGWLSCHFQRIYFADTVARAQQALQMLAGSGQQSGVVVFTQAGDCLTPHTVRFAASAQGDTAAAGLLLRQQRVETLAQELHGLEQAITADGEKRQTCEAALQTVVSQIRETRQQQQAQQQLLHRQQLDVQRQVQHQEHAQQQQQQAQQELDSLEQQLLALDEQMELTQGQQDDAGEQLEYAKVRSDEAQQQVQRAEQELAQARDALLQKERESSQVTMRLQALEARSEQWVLQQQQAQTVMGDVQSQLEQLREEEQQLTAAAAQTALQSALALKAQRQTDLGTVRSRYDGLTEQLRVQSEQRMQLDRDVEPIRQRISERQLAEQEQRLRKESYSQQLQTAAVDMEEVRAYALAQQLSNKELEATCKKLQQRMQAMGPVNLAALQELEQESERRGYLESQYDDLQQAVQTLEAAIVQIDSETRDLLTDTYNAVNQSFGRLFPRLFGGGRAYLRMTDEEILHCGVQVMAQPPGKKNQTIQLLSGGEKALTAIALVFAMFELNPAPFCLLDEVDAPLDDANTSRYVELVKEMSRQTQFLFISHNKVAMEAAQQLVGVTMQERGVSRVVAVDIESALETAEQ